MPNQDKEMAKTDFKNIEEYLKTMPVEIVPKLQEMRQIIHAAAPEAEEAISYQIPTFKLNGKFVGYFAGFKDHISFYPLPKDDEKLLKEMEPYVAGKGTLRFSLDKPLPKVLISKVVKYWVEFRKGQK